MSRDEIIAMAQEAGFEWSEMGLRDRMCFERFAALAAATEREAIAAHYEAHPHVEFFGRELADEIRARSKP